MCDVIKILSLVVPNNLGCGRSPDSAGTGDQTAGGPFRCAPEILGLLVPYQKSDPPVKNQGTDNLRFLEHIR